MKQFAITLKYLKERKYYLLVGLISLFMVDILQLLIPKVVQYVIDDLSAFKLTSESLFRYLLMVIGLALSIAFFRFWWRICIIGTAYKIEQKLRGKIYNHLLTLDQDFFQETKVGDIMAHVTNDLQAVRMVFGMGFIAFFDGIGLTILSISFMANIDFKLTLLVLIPLPILSIIVVFLGKKLHKRFGAVQESFSDLTGKTQESVAGIRVVKNFNLQDFNLKEFAGFSDDLVKKNISLVKIWGLFFPIMSAIIGISAAIILYAGGQYTIKNIISIGELVAFNTYLGILAWPMMAIGWVMNIFQRGKASIERINKILNEKPKVFEKDGAVSVDLERVNLEVKNLNFTYQGAVQPTLKNINLFVNNGEKIAIVGKTGSGKTTLINLLLRVYDNYEGDIVLNGQEIREIKISCLRNIVCLVNQETFLFSDSIAQNIAFTESSGEPLLDKVNEAAKAARIYENISNFPEGFNTELGEKGVNLSGGQKQRISIARALYKDSPLLILDDSLSAVDTETEEQILQNLSKNIEAKSAIIISHRISSIKNCDRIYLLDDGEIKESGKHTELLELRGHYFEMYEKQQLEEIIND